MDIADIIKYQTLDIPCPQCHATHTKTIDWLNENSHIHCPCGEFFAVNQHSYQNQRRAIEQRFQKYLKEPATPT